MSESKNTLTVKDGEFEQAVIKNSGLRLVDFWAEWCGPCHALAPVIEDLAKQYEGKVSVYKMDIDENPQTPQKYQIRGIPTVILFRDGEVVERFVGVQPKTKLEEGIKKHLKS